MRGKLLPPIAFLILAVLIGCHKDATRRQMPLKNPKPKEEIILPPDEARFNNPPSAESSSKPKVVDEKESLFGNKKGGKPY
jgi:hypothetical protein